MFFIVKYLLAYFSDFCATGIVGTTIRVLARILLSSQCLILNWPVRERNECGNKLRENERNEKKLLPKL
jgi:hypothetical protein